MLKDTELREAVRQWIEVLPKDAKFTYTDAYKFLEKNFGAECASRGFVVATVLRPTGPTFFSPCHEAWVRVTKRIGAPEARHTLQANVPPLPGLGSHSATKPTPHGVG
jgi:hypothetical protein